MEKMISSGEWATHQNCSQLKTEAEKTGSELLWKVWGSVIAISHLVKENLTSDCLS